MKITCNGQPRELAEDATIASLLGELQMNPRYVAVELNEELLPREKHATRRLKPGDSVEIVTLVGGG